METIEIDFELNRKIGAANVGLHIVVLVIQLVVGVEFEIQFLDESNCLIVDVGVEFEIQFLGESDCLIVDVVLVAVIVEDFVADLRIVQCVGLEWVDFMSELDKGPYQGYKYFTKGVG